MLYLRHAATSTAAAVLLLLGTPALAQRGIGGFLRQPGSEPATLSGPMTVKIKLKGGTTKVFDLVAYEEGYGDSPLGKDNERLPGLMFRLQLPDGLPVRLESPVDGQKIILVTGEPDNQPSFIASNVAVRSVLNPDKPLQDSNSQIEGTGYFSIVMHPFGEQSAFVVGLPHTRLDIDALRDSKDYLLFYGKKWRPKATGPSLIIVNWVTVVGVNVTVDDISPPVAATPKK